MTYPSRWIVLKTFLLILPLWAQAAPAASAQAAAGGSVVYIHLGHWSYEALDRLASLGLLPLSSVVTRPITRLQALGLVKEAAQRARDAPGWVRALAEPDLQNLVREFTAQGASGRCVLGAGGSYAGSPAVTLRGGCALGNSYAVGGSLPVGSNAVETGRAEWYVSARVGSVLAGVGALPSWWGPGFRSSLVLSHHAGPLPGLRLGTQLVPNVYLTKIVAPLERGFRSEGTGYLHEGTVYFFGTRLDWDVRPGLRLGFTEVVLTPLGPMTAYHLLNPLPLLLGTIASYDLHDAFGQIRNTLVGADFDWLVSPGFRLYGAALVDDAPALPPRPGSKVGLMGGLYLADPFRNGRTSVRIEYAAVTRGTYTYGAGLDYTYFGRTLGHVIGPGGDELFMEVGHRLGAASILQLSYALTNRLTQPEVPRHTLRLQYTRMELPAATRYWIELGRANGWDVLAGLDLYYNPGNPGSLALEAAPMPPAAAAVQPAWEAGVRAWPAYVTSRGPFAGPRASATYLGVAGRYRWNRWTLSLDYDTAGTTGWAWSANAHYELFPGLDSVGFNAFAGWGGVRYQGDLGGASRVFESSGAMMGAEGRIGIAFGDLQNPLHLRGRIASGSWIGRVSMPSYLWTYTLGLDWEINPRLRVEAGYRGMAWVLHFGTPDRTTLLWDGLYLSLSTR